MKELHKDLVEVFGGMGRATVPNHTPEVRCRSLDHIAHPSCIPTQSLPPRLRPPPPPLGLDGRPLLHRAHLEAIRDLGRTHIHTETQKHSDTTT